MSFGNYLIKLSIFLDIYSIESHCPSAANVHNHATSQCWQSAGSSTNDNGLTQPKKWVNT